MIRKQKRMGPVGCFGQIENIKRQSLIILKTRFLGKTEDTIIAHHIPARDIVSHSNCRFGKRRQKNCLMAIVRIKLKIPDEGLSSYFNLRARSVASIRFFHKKAF